MAIMNTATRVMVGEYLKPESRVDAIILVEPKSLEGRASTPGSIDQESIQRAIGLVQGHLRSQGIVVRGADIKVGSIWATLNAGQFMALETAVGEVPLPIGYMVAESVYPQ